MLNCLLLLLLFFLPSSLSLSSLLLLVLKRQDFDLLDLSGCDLLLRLLRHEHLPMLLVLVLVLVLVEQLGRDGNDLSDLVHVS